MSTKAGAQGEQIFHRHRCGDYSGSREGLVALETGAGRSLLLRGSVTAGGITLEGAGGATVVSGAVVTDFATPVAAAAAAVFICDNWWSAVPAAGFVVLVTLNSC